MRAWAKMRSIINEVAEEFGVNAETLTGRSRSSTLTEARCIIVARTRNETRLSLSEIGEELGRSHGSVIYYLRRAAELDDDPEASMTDEELLEWERTA